MISVIVPIYNTASLLPRCIDSLLNQTLDNIEIILVNDASPVNSLEIIKDYEKKYFPKIKTISSKINLKQGGARNLGIELAQGEYIGFVDSDDWCEPTMYQLLYEKAKSTNSEICYCYRKRVDENNNVLEDKIRHHLHDGLVNDENLK